MDLITLIRNNNCEIKYNVEYQKEWSDDELLSHIIFLNCPSKQLTTLPDLINCQQLSCRYNQLTTLSDLINCQILFCNNNQLIYDSIEEHKKLVKFRNFYKHLKYLKKWRLYKTKSIINKKKDLMIELLYSPDLPFYKLNPYYIHFIENKNQ